MPIRKKLHYLVVFIIKVWYAHTALIDFIFEGTLYMNYIQVYPFVIFNLSFCAKLHVLFLRTGLWDWWSNLWSGLLNSLSGKVLIEPGFVLCLFLPETDLYHPLPYFNRLHFPSKARQISEDHWWGKRLQPWRTGEKETPAWLGDNFWLEMWLDLTREQMSEHLLFGTLKVFRNLAPYHTSRLLS